MNTTITSRFPSCDQADVFAHHKQQPTSCTKPKPEGEVVELVARLKAIRNDYGVRHSTDCHRAAALLQHHQPPQPVAVSERLPRLEDCDAEGRCWWWAPKDPECPLTGHDSWGLYDGACDEDTHWLPFHALPTPPEAP